MSVELNKLNTSGTLDRNDEKREKCADFRKMGGTLKLFWCLCSSYTLKNQIRRAATLLKRSKDTKKEGKKGEQ